MRRHPSATAPCIRTRSGIPTSNHARLLATSVFVGAALVASLGGCPASPVNPALPGDLPPIEGSVGDPSGAGSDPIANDPTTASVPGGGGSLRVGDADFATFQDQPVSLALDGPVWAEANQAVDLNNASIAIVGPPTAGTLDGPQTLEGNRIGFTYTPPAGFVGSAQFHYVARVANDESNVGLVTIEVYPDIQFDVQTSEDVNDLTGRAYALTVSGPPLPDGTYIWTLDGVEDSGPMATHHERFYTFSPNQVHVLTLSVVLAGFSGPVACRSALDGTAEIRLKIPPAISGTIVDQNGQPMPDVVISGHRIRNPAVSEAQGRYTVHVPRNWSGALRPAQPGATFQPPERFFSKVRRDLAGENFRGAGGFVTISGRVLDANGAALADVLFSADNGGGSATTNAQGDYALSLPRDWSGRVTPSAAGYTFSPAYRDYAPLSGDLSQQDYGATADPASAFTISGRVLTLSGAALANVLLSADNGGGSTTTNLQGGYALTLPRDWSGRVTPSAGGYTFTPAFRDYTLLGGDRTQQDYDASLVTSGNQPPIAFDQSVTTNEDTAVNITLTASDPNNNPLEFVVLQLAAAGRLRDIGNGRVVVAGDLPYTLAASGAVLEYLPNADYNGADAFTFTAFDGTVLGNTATISVTVNAVNDAPSFDVPPSSGMAVGTPFVVNMTNVLSGPPDEAWQTVSFSARSSDQSVIPNGNLEFVGPRLTITAIAAGGPVTISVTGVDDGGTANGGVNSSGGGFQMTAVTGPVISGSISRVATVGANPPVGPVHLRFTGSGASTGMDFSVTSQVDGAYAAQVPSGWTGTVAAADPNHTYLTPLSRDYSSPVTAPQLNQDYSAWIPPIGIPAPEFGIKETHDMYAGQRFDFNGNGILEPGEEYRDAGDGPYTHYIDNTHPNATDTNNPYGTSGRPRLTVEPYALLPAGSVVEIHGGPYTWNVGRDQAILFYGNGTPQQPIFARGPSPANRPLLNSRVVFEGSYIILENMNIDFTNAGANGVGCRPSTHHVSIRNSEIHEGPELTTSAVGLGGGDNGPSVHDIVVHNNVIHDNGNWLANYDEDHHAVGVGRNADHIWVVDNEMYHNSGDGIQINARMLGTMPATHHIYIGRNLMHHNKQYGATIKFAVDVVISQNTMYSHRPSDSSNGCGISWNYGPERVWMLFNHIYDSDHGIKTSTASGPGGWGPGQDVYIIGNLIHDIHRSPPGPYTPSGYDDPNNPWKYGIALRFSDEQAITTKHVIGNTIYDADAGIVSPRGFGSIRIANNIFSGIVEQDIFLDIPQAAGASSIQTTLFDNLARIRWGTNTTYDLASFRIAHPGLGLGCLEGEARFRDPAQADFHLLAGSPAVDNGAADAVYDTFLSQYGIDIRVNIEGMSIPVDGNGNGSAVIDMGAYEYRRP